MADNLFSVFAGPGDPDDPDTQPVENVSKAAPASSTVERAFAQLGQAGDVRSQSPGMFTQMVPFYGQHKAMKAMLQRQASLAQVQGAAGNLIDNLVAEGMPVERANAIGMMQTARRLQELGFSKEAWDLRQVGLTQMKAARDTAQARRKLEGEIRYKDEQTENLGLTDFRKNSVQREELAAQLEAAGPEMSAQERASLARQIGWLDAKLLKDTAITGKTEWDMRNDPVFLRNQFKEVMDLDVLLANIDATEELLNLRGEGEETWWAKQKADFLGFAENYLGRSPTESEREFRARVMDPVSRMTLLAAKIRHALTGAQMSHFEIKYLEPFLPSPNDSEYVIRQKLASVRGYLQLERDVRSKMFESGETENFFLGNRTSMRYSKPTVPSTPGDAAIPETSNAVLDSVLNPK